jgi:flagellin
MSNSINTNLSAMVALGSLRTAGAMLATASKQVQTGYRVADAMDDSSTFTVAQGIRGNLQAFQAVQASITNGTGLGAVTDAALTNISNLVGNLQAKITQLADGAISNGQRTIYAADFSAMTSQISTFIRQANYNGVNLLSNNSAAKTFLADVNATTITMSSRSTVHTAFTTFAASSVSSVTAATAALTSLSTFGSAVSAAPFRRRWAVRRPIAARCACKASCSTRSSMRRRRAWAPWSTPISARRRPRPSRCRSASSLPFNPSRSPTSSRSRSSASCVSSRYVFSSPPLPNFRAAFPSAALFL